MFEKLDQILKKHKLLEERLSDPDLIKDRKKFEQTAREHKEISRIVAVYAEWRSLKKSVDGARLLLEDSDPEIREIAKEEIEKGGSGLAEMELRIRRLMLPTDPNDEKNVIIEVRAGTGGDEAALFAADLYRMYARFAENQGWIVEELNRNENNLGGVKEVTALIKGGQYETIWARE